VTGDLETAREAFARLSRGLATGEWEPFLETLSDDFVFWFPMGKFKGRNEGRERAREFFAFVSSVYDTGLFVTLDRSTHEGGTTVFEFHDEGLLRGAPYSNRVAIALETRDGKIVEYREYFGLVG
jgi:ketosteroid isomerase-like protein